MTHGIAISTYFGPTTPEGRFDIFKECITSLLNSGYPGKIFLVDDCSITTDHFDYCQDFKQIIIIRRSKNGGESKVKNTSLRILLDAGCDYFFISDDDMIFKRNFWRAYISVAEAISFRHMTYVCDHVQVYRKSVNGIDLKVVNAETTSGCFLLFARSIVEELGGWPNLITAFGHGHENYSMRCVKFGGVPFYADIINSKQFLLLNPKSNKTRSIKISKEEIDKNLYVLENIRKYENLHE